MQPNQTRRKKFYNFHKLPRVGEETGGELLWKGGTQTLCICHNPFIKEPRVGAQDRHLCCPSFNHLWVAVANCRGKHIASLCFENQEIVKYEHCIAASVYAHEECVVMLSFHHKHQLLIKFPYHEQHCWLCPGTALHSHHRNTVHCLSQCSEGSYHNVALVTAFIYMHTKGKKMLSHKLTLS